MAHTIVTNPTEAELVAAVPENLYALFRSMQAIPGCEVVESDKLSRHHAFPDNPMFKGVWRTRLSPEEVDDVIDEMSAWFEQRQAPSFFWWTDPQTHPADLMERLLKRGFDGNWEGDPGMVMDVHQLQDEVSAPNGFTIVRATDQTSLEDWRDVFAVSFETPVSAGQAWVDATLTTEPRHAPWKMYVGYLGNKPVATSILFTGAGVAGIYGVGTVPEARGRGFGRAITLKPLLDARKQGYRFAVLFSSRMGYPLYQRLGFREVACKIGIYILEKH